MRPFEDSGCCLLTLDLGSEILLKDYYSLESPSNIEGSNPYITLIRKNLFFLFLGKVLKQLVDEGGGFLGEILAGAEVLYVWREDAPCADFSV